MVAEPMTRAIDDEVIDLDSLTVAELYAEQLAVKSEIAEIQAQIHDATRRESMGADYYPWRRRAGWALMKKEQERLAIHAALYVKGPLEKAARKAARAEDTKRRTEQAQAEAAERRALRAAAYEDLTAEQQERKRADEATRAAQRAAAGLSKQAEVTREAREKRAALLAELETEGGTDWLLLRVVVAFRHLAGDNNGLPETVTAEDRHALKLARTHLRDRIGIAALRDAEHAPVQDGHP